MTRGPDLARSVEALAHDHNFLGAAHDDNARRTRIVVVLTFAMMIGEIAAGYLTGSMALLADGFHMATHAGALGVAAFAYSYARRHAGEERRGGRPLPAVPGHGEGGDGTQMTPTEVARPGDRAEDAEIPSHCDA